MKRFGIFGWIGVIFCLGWMTPLEVFAERSMSRSKLEKELKHLRASLHEAHRELGIKADRIAKLEARLAKSSKGADEVVTEKSAKQSGKCSDAAEGPTEVMCQEKKETVPEKRVSDPQVSKQVTKTIHYDRNSAVNYDGRENLLKFVQEELARFPEARFSVEATANDSAFQAKDRDIASNRARFLVEYLKIRGIPEEVFSDVVGKTTDEKGRGGRMAQLTSVRNP